MNPNGNHPVIPTLPDGTRDVLHDWKLKDTWKQMEEVLKKGQLTVSFSASRLDSHHIFRQSKINWGLKFLGNKARGNPSNSRNRSRCQPGE